MEKNKQDIRFFEIDFEKVKDIEDVRVILKMLILGWNFNFNDPDEIKNYNEFKHLLKEKI